MSADFQRLGQSGIGSLREGRGLGQRYARPVGLEQGLGVKRAVAMVVKEAVVWLVDWA